MRPRIEGLDVASLEWKPLGPPGLYSKLLSRDPETGARTALQRLCPADSYEPPKVAHFHTTYEEILGVSGLFTFDSRTWIRPGSYVFHPPRTVHGFKSAVPQESWFLSRVGRDLDINLVPEPERQDLYVIEGPVPPRRPVALADPLGETAPQTRSFLGAPVEWRALSHEPQSGEGSALAIAPAGWRSTPTRLAHYLEIFALKGCLSMGGGPPPVGHAYSFYPPDERIGAVQAETDIVLYLNYGGALPE